MDFSHVDTWIFDLDNTLYPPEADLFGQIEVKMNGFVMRHLGLGETDANRMRRDYWERYGTTLAGMMAEHQVDPTQYLAEVHDIDFSVLTPTPGLTAAIDALPGRKLIHTNADSRYAKKVLSAAQLGPFEAIYGVEETGYHPKPERAAYEAVIEQSGINPKRAAFFEDDPRNLAVPHELGMRTILVGAGRDGPNSFAAGEIGPHVEYQTNNLTAFLQEIVDKS